MNPASIGTRLRRGAIVAGAAALVVLGVACTPDTTVTVAPEGAAQGISVAGEGSVSVRPDIAVLNIGVEVTADTVADARSDAADAMSAIQDALDAEGVSSEDIQTQYFNIYPQYRYSEDRAPEITGFTVMNEVRVTIRDIDNASAALDAAIAAGGDAVRVNGIRFTVDDPEQFLSDARREAVENARERAQVLADAAGVTLGDPISISESNNFGGFEPYPTFDRAEGMGGSSPVSPGEQELRVNVSVLFGIEQ